MTKPIAVLGTAGSLPSSFAWTTATAFEATGANTGNLAFQYATFNRVLGEARLTVPFAFDPAAVKEHCRLLCIPAANFLYSGFDLGSLADRLEATGLPLLVLGLGAQAFKDVSEVKLKPGTERLLHLFRERCTRIMVRGRHTAAVLERSAVHNFEVLGCPSNFINPDPALGESIAARWRAGPPRRIAFAPTFYPFNAPVERAILAAIGPARLTDLVAQDPLGAVALARGEEDGPGGAWLTERAGFLSQMPPTERGMLVRRLRAWFSAEAWIEAYRRSDAVIGTRIHGAALGWQAGRGALVVGYDLRTEELAETMGLPFVKASALPDAGALATLSDGVEAMAPAYDARRRDLAARLVALLGEHGVAPGAVLARLAAGVAPPKPTADASAPADPAPEPPRHWGFLEQYNRRRVAGWIASNGTEVPRVTVRFDGREIATVRPTVARPDIGRNAWAFDVRVPADAVTRDVVRVEALSADTGAPLRNSPVVTSVAANDADKVLKGREGFLFLRNDSNGVLDQVTGRRPLSPAELDRWEAFFRDLDGAAASREARVVYLVAPNKECVLAEHLPDDVTVSEARPVRQIQALAARMDLRATRVIYPLEALRRADARFPAYPKGDSHWSEYGAALALRALWEALGGPPDSAEEEFRTEFRNADLLSKLGGACIEQQPVLTRRPVAVLEHDNGVLNTGRRRVLRPGRAAEARPERLLMLHDSFGEWLIPSLAERFASTVAIWGASLGPEVLEEVSPDIILLERAERFLVVPPRFG
ncbi:polysaccharide pyruvyl transferase family protein [Roseomonas sp. CCTCC AB2023176]|uniref:polysaccharide pyruvyl transferase family protein n=1 Tax=Roseomonas sp. CCTCC AB2023176 TaxID=3342640 RepID=UPI0035DD4C13